MNPVARQDGELRYSNNVVSRRDLLVGVPLVIAWLPVLLMPADQRGGLGHDVAEIGLFWTINAAIFTALLAPAFFNRSSARWYTLAAVFLFGFFNRAPRIPHNIVEMLSDQWGFYLLALTAAVWIRHRFTVSGRLQLVVLFTILLASLVLYDINLAVIKRQFAGLHIID